LLPSVSHIDLLKQQYHPRSESRARSRTIEHAGRPDPALRKAKDRLRNAAWRNEQDQLRRPEAAVIAMALLKALCTIESVEQVDEKTAGILTKRCRTSRPADSHSPRQKLSCAGFENVGGMNHDLVRDAVRTKSMIRRAGRID
jgi:hypothetical protein